MVCFTRRIFSPRYQVARSSGEAGGEGQTCVHRGPNASVSDKPLLNYDQAFKIRPNHPLVHSLSQELRTFMAPHFHRDDYIPP